MPSSWLSEPSSGLIHCSHTVRLSQCHFDSIAVSSFHVLILISRHSSEGLSSASSFHFHIFIRHSTFYVRHSHPYIREPQPLHRILARITAAVYTQSFAHLHIHLLFHLLVCLSTTVASCMERCRYEMIVFLEMLGGLTCGSCAKEALLEWT